MAQDISIISRLKKIALTSIDLGREIAKEKANQVSSNLRESRAGKLLESTQKRIDEVLRRQSPVKAKTVAHKRTPGKRHLGAAKYSAKTARLTPS
ncbi:MAG: hypothetical protein REI12_01770 [Pedobacter sp.]|nr:hypothetical protein [Pedobacter sp.]